MDNTNNTNGSMGGNTGAGANPNNAPLDPIFKGMPKPGQPLVPTPSTSVPGAAGFIPKPSTAVPSNPMIPSSSAYSNSATSNSSNPSGASSASSTFKQVNSYTPPTPTSPASASTTTTSAQSTYKVGSAASPSSSGAVSNPARVPVGMEGSSGQSAASYAAATRASSVYSTTPATSSTSANSTPSHTVPSASSAAPSSSVPSSAPTYSVPPTYSAGASVPPSVTASRLSAEVNSVLASENQPPKKSSANTMIISVVAIVVLLLLAGGGYYWYMNNSTNEFATPDTDSPSNQNGSMFPTGARPATSTRPNTQTPPTTSRPVQVNTPFTQAERAKVESYIRANINRLSGIRTTIPFQVTDVTFDGPDRAIVEFSNGQASYTAVAVADIDAAGNVVITSFALLEK